MIKINVLGIESQADNTARVSFKSGSSDVTQTLFAPWKDVKDLEPGKTYNVSFSAAEKVKDESPAAEGGKKKKDSPAAEGGAAE